MSSSSLLLGSEILQKHTIPELRDLVGVLQDDCKSKKNELQLMVGSKYHDFIDSADLVASMHQKTELISSRFDEFIALNRLVSQKTNSLLALTSQKEKGSGDISSNIYSDKLSISDLFGDVGSSVVWQSLNDCDVFNAARTLLIGQLIQTAASSSTNPAERQGPCYHGKFFSPETIAAVRVSLQSLSERDLSDLLSHVQSAEYLSSTVREDARLLLLQDSWLTAGGPAAALGPAPGSESAGSGGVEPVDKARALVTLSLLRTRDQDAEMEEFLEAADERLKDVMDTVAGSQCVQRLDTPSRDGTEGGEGEGGRSGYSPAEGKDVESLSVRVSCIVRVLQEVIMDAFLLFFRPVPLSATPLQPDLGQGSGQVTGLVSACHYSLFKSIIDPLLRVNQSSSFDYSEVLPDVASFLRSVTAATVKRGQGAHHSQQVGRKDVSAGPHRQQEAGRRDRFQGWFRSAAVALTERTRGLLSSVQSANEVAQLQHCIFVRCRSLSVGPHLPPSDPNPNPYPIRVGYSQSLWEEASLFLLPGIGAGGEDSSPNLTSLWSIAFRDAFMNQVERLLQSSCKTVLARTRDMLVRTLRAEGLTVDASTLAVSVSLPSVPARPAPSSSGIASGTSSSSSSRDPVSVSPTSSATIYVLADRIQHQFEDNLTQLLQDVIHPMQGWGAEGEGEGEQGAGAGSGQGVGTDVQSSLALTRALRVQCSHVIGQLLVSLRLLAEACRAALAAQGDLTYPPSPSPNPNPSQSAKKAPSVVSEPLKQLIRTYCGGRGGRPNKDMHRLGSVSGQGAGRGQGVAAVVSGLLLVGRLAWLLRVRSGVIEHALTLTLSSDRRMTSGGGDGEGGEPDLDLNSEDQFRSAFEIADTDGDGVLTYPEAIEAVGALAVGDSFGRVLEGQTDLPLPAAVGLSARLTPTLTYPEFVLICGSQMLATRAYRPLLRAQRILDDIIGVAHVCWAVWAVQSQCEGLQGAVGAELCFDQVALTSSHSHADSSYGSKRHQMEKLFKLSWQPRWVDLGGGPGATGDQDQDPDLGGGDEEGSAGTDGKEKLMVPATLTCAVGRVLAALGQQAALAVVSIDAMQRLALTSGHPLPSVQTPVPPSQATDKRRDVDLDLDLDSDSLEIRDPDLDLDLDGLGSVDRDRDRDRDLRTSPLAVILEGSSRGAGSGSVSLSEICLSLLLSLAAEQVHLTYSQHLSVLRGTKSSAASASLLEEAALQVIFDLTAAQSLALRDKDKDSSVGLSPFRSLLGQWRQYLDPITAELLLPLVEEAALLFLDSAALLLPSLSSGTTAGGRSQGARGGSEDKKHSSSSSSQSSSSSSTEALLQAVFPQQQSRLSSSSSSSSASSSSSSTVRFALLPLAISTSASSSFPTSSTASSGAGAGTGSSGVGSGSSSGAAANSGKGPVQSGNSSKPATALKWW